MTRAVPSRPPTLLEQAHAVPKGQVRVRAPPGQPLAAQGGHVTREVANEVVGDLQWSCVCEVGWA